MIPKSSRLQSNASMAKKGKKRNGKSKRRGGGKRHRGRQGKRMSVQQERKLRDIHNLARTLAKASEGELTSVLKCMNKHGRNAMYECIRNTLYHKGIPKFKQRELRAKLEPHKKDLKYLADGKRSEVRRRKLLVQKGGILPIILSVVAPLISSLLSSVL